MWHLPRTNLGIFLLALPVVMVATYLTLSLATEEQASLVGNVANPAFATAAATLGFALYWITRKTPSKEIDLGLVMVFVLLALGEIAYSVFVEILGKELDVSIADLFWLSSYILLVVLLNRVVRSTQAFKSKNVVKVEIAFWLLASSLIGYVLLTSVQSQDLGILEKLTWNLYTLLDVIILSLLILLLWAFRKGLLEDCWRFVAISMCFMTVGDLLFTVYDAAGSYYVGSPPDVFYIGSYVLLTLGFGMLFVGRLRGTSIAEEDKGGRREDEMRDLAPRTTYVVWENDSRKAYEFMVRGLTAGLEGLVVASKPPNSIRPTYGLKKTEIIWLSTSGVNGAIHPANLGILTDTITRFLEKGSSSIVLLDGFDALVTYGDFKKALQTLDHLKDVVMATDSRLIVTIDRRTMSEKEASLIEKKAVPIQG